MNVFLKSTFHISVLFLIIISLWPGSLIGYLLYRDWGLQPILISGANSPLGIELCELFLKKKFNVIGVVRNLNTESGIKLSNKKNIIIWEHDLSNEHSIENLKNRIILK